MKHLLLVLIILTSITGCTCKRVPQVDAIQPGDKRLSCSDINLAINEAEFQRKNFKDNRVTTINPLCAPGEFGKTGEGIKSINARIDYLTQIYELMDCAEKERLARKRRMPPAPPPIGHNRIVPPIR